MCVFRLFSFAFFGCPLALRATGNMSPVKSSAKRSPNRNNYPTAAAGCSEKVLGAELPCAQMVPALEKAGGSVVVFMYAEGFLF